MEPDCMFMQILIEIKSARVTSHTFLCFLCATVTSSEVKFFFPKGKCEHSQYEQDQAHRKSSQEHKDKAFSKASMNG